MNSQTTQKTVSSDAAFPGTSGPLAARSGGEGSVEQTVSRLDGLTPKELEFHCAMNEAAEEFVFELPEFFRTERVRTGLLGMAWLVAQLCGCALGFLWKALANATMAPRSSGRHCC